MLEFRCKYALGSLGPSSMKPSSASIVALRLVASRGWGKPFLQQLASSGVGSRPQLQISLLVQPSLVNSSLPIGRQCSLMWKCEAWPFNWSQAKSAERSKNILSRDTWTCCCRSFGPHKRLNFGGAFAKWLFVRGKQELGIDFNISEIDVFPFAEKMTDVIYLQYWQSNNSNFPKFQLYKICNNYNMTMYCLYKHMYTMITNMQIVKWLIHGRCDNIPLKFWYWWCGKSSNVDINLVGCHKHICKSTHLILSYFSSLAS